MVLLRTLTGWIAALRTEEQVTNRIMLHNVTLPILLSFEYEQGVGDDDHKWQTTLTSYHFFERLVPSGIHSCRSHVNGAVYGWVVNKDRKPEVKNLGKRFVNMFTHIADRMTSMESIRDAMTILAHIIVLL